MIFAAIGQRGMLRAKRAVQITLTLACAAKYIPRDGIVWQADWELDEKSRLTQEAAENRAQSVAELRSGCRAHGRDHRFSGSTQFQHPQERRQRYSQLLHKRDENKPAAHSDSNPRRR